MYGQLNAGNMTNQEIQSVDISKWEKFFWVKIQMSDLLELVVHNNGHWEYNHSLSMKEPLNLDILYTQLGFLTLKMILANIFRNANEDIRTSKVNSIEI